MDNAIRSGDHPAPSRLADPSPRQFADIQARSEPELRRTVAARLRANGLVIDEQVACAAGAADIATRARDVIYEVKHRLTRRALQQAVGQLALYRSCLNPDARAVIVGYATAESAALIPHITALGIEVVCWQDDVQPAARSAIADAEAQLPARDGTAHNDTEAASVQPQPAMLCWKVQEHARRQGISSVRDLSFKLRTSRQTLYPLWRGESKCVSLEMLATLCRALDAQLGEWFSWDRDSDPDRRIGRGPTAQQFPGHGAHLRWRVQAAARAKGWSLQELAWRAAIVPHGLLPIWQGEQQFVFVETLAKLARALDLSVGDLFVWMDADAVIDIST